MAEEKRWKNTELDNISQDPKVMECAAALNEVIRFRGITLEELSEKCGIPADTLQKYTATALDIRQAGALDVIHLAEALDVDPAILLGEQSIDVFKQEVGKTGIDEASLAYLREMLSRPIRG